ncbi:MAG: hypothetical protein MMC33_008310 [Icmadophila ericetorum]|nr:hypothetical protein [Icmadophila ericetorum]
MSDDQSLPVSDAFVGMEAEKQNIKTLIKAARASELFKEPAPKNTPEEYIKTKERAQKVRIWTFKLAHIFEKQGEEVLQLVRVNIDSGTTKVKGVGPKEVRERIAKRNELENESRRIEGECEKLLGWLQELKDLLMEKEMTFESFAPTLEDLPVKGTSRTQQHKSKLLVVTTSMYLTQLAGDSSFGYRYSSVLPDLRQYGL